MFASLPIYLRNWLCSIRPKHYVDICVVQCEHVYLCFCCHLYDCICHILYIDDDEIINSLVSRIFVQPAGEEGWLV